MIAWLDRRRAVKGWDRGFEQRLAEWHRGGPELSEPEAKRYLDGVDPDFSDVGPQLAEIEERVREGRYDDVLLGAYDERKLRRQILKGRLMMAFVAISLGGLAYSIVHAKLEKARTAAALAHQIAAHELPTADLGRNPATLTTSDRDTVIGTHRSDKIIRQHSRYVSGRAAALGADGGWLAFEGEMAVHSWAAAFNIATPSARLHFNDGLYAVRSIRGTDETRVRVDSGTMLVRGILDTAWRATLHAGDRAIVTRDGHVTVVSTDDGFPNTAFTPPPGSFWNDTVVTRNIRRGFRASTAAVRVVEP